MLSQRAGRWLLRRITMVMAQRVRIIVRLLNVLGNICLYPVRGVLGISVSSRSAYSASDPTDSCRPWGRTPG